MLVNVAWPGMCGFQSSKEGVQVVDCSSTLFDREKYAWILKVLTVIAYAFAVSYNIRLLLYVKKEQKRKRVQFIRKKQQARRSPKVHTTNPSPMQELSLDRAPSTYSSRSRNLNVPQS